MAGFTNPDFTGMSLGESPSADSKEWRALFEGETGRTFEALTHKTMERVPVSPFCPAARLRR